MKYHSKLYLFLSLVIFCSSLLTAQRDEEGSVKTKSFPVSKGGNLDVSVNAGDIRITPWEKDEVNITVRAEDEGDIEDLSMTSQGNTVTVENSSGDYGSEDMHYTISVPSQFSLRLQTSNGGISVESPITGALRATTSAGDVHISDVTGNVELQTSGGDIRAGNTVGDLEVQTSGGDIRIGSVSGEASVNTSGGDIRIKDVKKSLRARTAGGNVTLGDVGGTADVSTSGGNIIAGKVSGSATLGTAGGDIELQSATGAVRAKTAGGNLRILDVSGTIDGRTAGGDIEAELTPSGKGGSRLTTAAGEIQLSIPENAKATIKARIKVQGSWGRHRDESYSIMSDFKADSYEKVREDREIHATYTLNGGGEPITLETANANIRIVKLHSRPK